MNKTVVANWKMNPQTLEEAKELFSFYVSQSAKHSAVNIIICPPVIYLEEVVKLKKESRHVVMGAQDFFWEEAGAFTGQVSLNMLRQFDVKYALLGHSEKRYIAGETDEMINKKLLAALKHNVRPILLVGEKEKSDSREDILIDQLSRDLAGVDNGDISDVVLVYEPVWAISSNSGGQSDTPENAIEAIKIIKNIISKMFPGELVSNVPVLYGGSVNSKNISDFLIHDEIAGAVIGSSGLKKDEISPMLDIINKLSN